MPHLLLLHQPLFHHHHHHLPHTTTTTTTAAATTTTTTTSRSSSLVVVNPRRTSMKTHNNFLFQQQTLSRTVKCMANPRRVKMVARQIHREISTMLITDKVLKFAVLPEAALGADRYLSSLTTVSDVEISPDLQIAKVYVSFFGDESGKEVALAGLKSKAKYVRAQLGRRMRLRLTPEVRFIEDDSLERGSRVIAILDRLKEERENEKNSVEGEDEDEDVDEDEEDDDDDDVDDEDEDEEDDDDEDEDEDEEEEEDDTDEGIIYVK